MSDFFGLLSAHYRLSIALFLISQLFCLTNPRYARVSICEVEILF